MRIREGVEHGRMTVEYPDAGLARVGIAHVGPVHALPLADPGPSSRRETRNLVAASSENSRNLCLLSLRTTYAPNYAMLIGFAGSVFPVKRFKEQGWKQIDSHARTVYGLTRRESRVKRIHSSGQNRPRLHLWDIANQIVPLCGEDGDIAVYEPTA